MAIPYKFFTRFLQNVWRSSSENLNLEKCDSHFRWQPRNSIFFHARRDRRVETTKDDAIYRSLLRSLYGSLAVRCQSYRS